LETILPTLPDTKPDTAKTGNEISQLAWSKVNAKATPAIQAKDMPAVRIVDFCLSDNAIK